MSLMAISSVTMIYLQSFYLFGINSQQRYRGLGRGLRCQIPWYSLLITTVTAWYWYLVRHTTDGIIRSPVAVVTTCYVRCADITDRYPHPSRILLQQVNEAVPERPLFTRVLCRNLQKSSMHRLLYLQYAVYDAPYVLRTMTR
jgi:hypothetical protein